MSEIENIVKRLKKRLPFKKGNVSIIDIKINKNNVEFLGEKEEREQIPKGIFMDMFV